MSISSPTPLNTEKALHSLNKMLSSSHNSSSLLTQCSHTANLSCLDMPQSLEMFCSLTATYLKALTSEHRLLLILFRRFSLTHSSSERPLLIAAFRHYFSSLFPHHFCCSTYNHVPMQAYVYLLLSTGFEPLKDMNHVSVVYLCPPKKNNPSSQKALSDICRFMHWSGTTSTWSTSYKIVQEFLTLSNDFIRTQPFTQRKGKEKAKPQKQTFVLKDLRKLQLLNATLFRHLNKTS